MPISRKVNKKRFNPGKKYTTNNSKVISIKKKTHKNKKKSFKKRYKIRGGSARWELLDPSAPGSEQFQLVEGKLLSPSGEEVILGDRRSTLPMEAYEAGWVYRMPTSSSLYRLTQQLRAGPNLPGWVPFNQHANAVFSAKNIENGAAVRSALLKGRMVHPETNTNLTGARKLAHIAWGIGAGAGSFRDSTEAVKESREKTRRMVSSSAKLYTSTICSTKARMFMNKNGSLVEQEFSIRAIVDSICETLKIKVERAGSRDTSSLQRFLFEKIREAKDANKLDGKTITALLKVVFDKFSEKLYSDFSASPLTWHIFRKCIEETTHGNTPSFGIKRVCLNEGVLSLEDNPLFLHFPPNVEIDSENMYKGLTPLSLNGEVCVLPVVIPTLAYKLPGDTEAAALYRVLGIGGCTMDDPTKMFSSTMNAKLYILFTSLVEMCELHSIRVPGNYTEMFENLRKLLHEKHICDLLSIKKLIEFIGLSLEYNSSVRILYISVLMDDNTVELFGLTHGGLELPERLLRTIFTRLMRIPLNSDIPHIERVEQKKIFSFKLFLTASFFVSHICSVGNEAIDLFFNDILKQTGPTAHDPLFQSKFGALIQSINALSHVEELPHLLDNSAQARKQSRFLGAYSTASSSTKSYVGKYPHTDIQTVLFTCQKFDESEEVHVVLDLIRGVTINSPTHMNSANRLLWPKTFCMTDRKEAPDSVICQSSTEHKLPHGSEFLSPFKQEHLTYQFNGEMVTVIIDPTEIVTKEVNETFPPALFLISIIGDITKEKLLHLFKVSKIIIESSGGASAGGASAGGASAGEGNIPEPCITLLSVFNGLNSSRTESSERLKEITNQAISDFLTVHGTDSDSLLKLDICIEKIKKEMKLDDGETMKDLLKELAQYVEEGKKKDVTETAGPNGAVQLPRKRPTRQNA